ncbi:hypothetical protein FQR65_LT11632 [Abscondita terminalis]|nr:hypothetical protein FQR65_LT11632 [Abscondita terminalis]
MEFPQYSNSNLGVENTDLQNDLFDLFDLYPDSEEEDFIQDENESDNEKLFENDCEAIEQGFKLNIAFEDPLLQSLKVKYGDSIFCNTDEENEVIMQCTDIGLRSVLIKNRVRAKQLRVLRNKLVKILQDCLDKIHNNICVKSINLTVPKLDTWKLGIPYFKDSHFYRCPENLDEIRKKNNNEKCIFDFRVGRRWTPDEHVSLQGIIERNYYKYQLNEAQHKLNVININIRNGIKCDQDFGELSQLEIEFRTIRDDPYPYRTPPQWCSEGLNWDEIADSFKDRTPHECKAMWNVYIHPDINKGPWTDEENNRIKFLVQTHNAQNWDLIASELNTNRSGYLVFLNYYSSLCQIFKNERFQVSEDEYLMEVVDKCRIGNFIPWRKVSSFFQDRSKKQLYHRYKYYLSLGNMVKGNFTEAEDIFIVYLVEKFGRDYSKCAMYVPNRSSIQIRNRHANYLVQVFSNFGQYSEAEDLRILNHVRVHGTKNWKSLAQELKRARSHVRQRYLTLKKWLEVPAQTLKDIPSRKLEVRSKQVADRYKRLQDIMEKLNSYSGEVNLDVIQKFIKNLDEQYSIFRPWRVARRKQSFVDKQLVDFFKGTCKIQREYKALDEQSVKDSAARVTKLLDLFGVPLNQWHDIETDESIFTEREVLVVNALRGTTEEKPSFEYLTPQIRFVLPPNLNTVLGLRGLIVKYHIHKNSNSIIDSEVARRIEDDLQQQDAKARYKIEMERRNFFERLHILFKWASIVSKSFPKQLEKVEATEPFEIESQQRIKGRPMKIRSPKIMAMVNARKRKLGCDVSNTDNTSVVVPSNSIPKEERLFRYFATTQDSESEKNQIVPMTGFRTVSAEVLERIKQNNKVVILDKPIPSLKIVKVARVNQIQSTE